MLLLQLLPPLPGACGDPASALGGRESIDATPLTALPIAYLVKLLLTDPPPLASVTHDPLRDTCGGDPYSKGWAPLPSLLLAPCCRCCMVKLP